jgi:gliding motility-associated-like protein
VGVPKFFSNNGYNDYWNVKGLSANFNGKSIIYIFNRFGKLLKQIIPTDQGWDGTLQSTASFRRLLVHRKIRGWTRKRSF